MKLANNKYQDNSVKELEVRRFTEAKLRLKDFIVLTNMSDDEERSRLLAYFSHRYASLITILKEAVRTKRLMKKSPHDVQYSRPAGKQTTEESKIFRLSNKNYGAGDYNEEEAEVEQER